MINYIVINVSSYTGEERAVHRPLKIRVIILYRARERDDARAIKGKSVTRRRIPRVGNIYAVEERRRHKENRLFRKRIMPIEKETERGEDASHFGNNQNNLTHIHTLMYNQQRVLYRASHSIARDLNLDNT